MTESSPDDSASAEGKPRADVLIVGGGPAGLATALWLRRAGLAVTVAETSDYRDFRVGEHLAAEALPQLARLDLTDSLWRPGGSTCPALLSFWGASEPTINTSFENPFGEGWILDRPAFDRRLAENAREAGVGLIAAHFQGKITRDARRGVWQVAFEKRGGGVTLEAPFVVDAGGRGARLALALGAQKIVGDHLVGLVGRLAGGDPDAPEDPCLLLEALPRGWWYSAGLESGRLVATLMTDRDLLGGASPRRAWHEACDQSSATRSRVARHGPLLDLHVRSARTQRLTSAAGKDWLAVGDAAITFDPLASAGIAKGFELGELAAAAISRHLAGDGEALSTYDRQVQEKYDHYLTLRARYYRLERRWPKETFWQRRHRSLAAEIPLYLAPEARLARAPDFPPPASREAELRDLGGENPTINWPRLLALAAEGKSARRVAESYRQDLGSSCMNRDILVALQQLLEQGWLLEQIAGDSYQDALA